MKTIRVMVVDDHKLIREGIISLILELDENILLWGEAENGMKAISLLEKKEDKPDVILMDVNMPDMNGIECTEEISKRYPDIKVLSLSMMKQGVHIQKMLKAGAAGYILKDCDKDELKEAIYSVYEGNPFFSAAVSDEVMKHLTKLKKTKQAETTPLSPREKEVLQLIVKDLTNQQIADRLHISIRTVETHKQNLLRKTGANSVAGLVVFAITNNVVEL